MRQPPRSRTFTTDDSNDFYTSIFYLFPVNRLLHHQRNLRALLRVAVPAVHIAVCLRLFFSNNSCQSAALHATMLCASGSATAICTVIAQQAQEKLLPVTAWFFLRPFCLFPCVCAPPSGMIHLLRHK